jgi:hypothetical protein
MRFFGAAVLGSALLAMTAAHDAAAQTTSSDVPPPGTRVRISVLGATPHVGILVGRTSDSLVVGWSNGTRDTVAISDVSRLDISRGTRRHVLRGAVIGLAVGTAGGLVKTMTANDDASFSRTQNVLDCINSGSCASLDDNSIAENRNRRFVPIGIAIGATAGALLGLISTEKWLPAAEVRVGVAPAASTRGVSLAFSVHF